MQVACPSCSSEYPVNERRLPASGLKMRCPKCGARFHVHPDGRVDAADAAPAAKPSELDLDLPAPKVPGPAKAPLGVFSAPKPQPPARAVRREAPTLDDLPARKPPAPLDGLDLDLPAPKAPAKPPLGAKRPLAPPAELGAKPRKPLAPPLDLDLPAPKPTVPAKPLAPRKPVGDPLGDLDLDLPAPKPVAPPSQELDLDFGTPEPAPLPASPSVEDLDLDLPAPKLERGGVAPPRKPLAPDFDSPRSGRASTPREPIAKLGRKPLAPAFEPPKPAPPEPDFDLSADLDLDLPAPKAAPTKPAPKARAPLAPDFELDLPAPKATPTKPAPKAKAPLAPDFALDLPAPKAAGKEPPPALAADGRNPFDELDLPSPKNVLAEADEVFGDLDLPMPKVGPASSGGFGELDLPLPKSSVPPAEPFGDIDLPAPRSDLPALKGDGLDGLDLLEPRSTLPASKEFGELDLPEPRSITDLPQLGGAAPDLPVARDGADLPVAKGHDFGELELSPAPVPRDAAGRTGVGGTAFGELDLGGEPADDMEFADLPQRPSHAGAEPELEPVAPPPRVAVDAKGSTKKPAPESKKSRASLVVGGLFLLLIAGGAALGFTPYGYFGMYYVDRFLPGAGDPAAVRAAIARAEEQAGSDTWASVRESLRTLASARHDAGLNRDLLARSMLHESLYQIRFGADPKSATRVSAIRSRLAERGLEGPELALALAADALRSGDARLASARVSAARNHAPNDPYVDLVAGEAALARGELAEARAAFERARERGAGARALWGIARASRGEAGERDAVEAVLSASPAHEDALLAKATWLFDEGELDAAQAIAEQVAGAAPVEGQRLRVSPRARAASWTLVGRIAEARGRATQALAAYDRALAAHDAHVPALLGAGRMLLGERPADAIARFDSVLSAGEAGQFLLANGRTAAQEAQLGSARANLALDRVQEAASVLEQLAAARTDDAEVLLWLGHAERRLDPPSREAAEAHYRAAISAAPQSFAGYLALAELFFETDRGTDAGTVLEQAAARVPESAEMRLELGRFELRRNRIPAAIRELRRALALDADLPAAHFSLGVAYRRSGRLDEAARTFEHLAQIDPGHPRLALERGLLFEARGQSERAVEAYRAALQENEGDMDLMLRLGAAQVAAGAIDEAEQTLSQVHEARPSSPEAAHFVGRVAFARGRYGEALAQLREAVRIDPTRGEFHLYVAWAALEGNLLGEALQSAEAAIERDPSLGEAYWVRAVVRLRSGNPAGALSDLTRALELRPSFHRVHATMGDAYDQLGRLSEAIAAYERAVRLVDDEGGWWWRLGRLRMDRGDRRGALTALSRATLLGEADTPLPGWLAAAHRLHGDALRLDGQRAEAVTHYRRYLALAAPGDIDRPEVRRILMDMGEVPGE